MSLLDLVMFGFLIWFSSLSYIVTGVLHATWFLALWHTCAACDLPHLLQNTSSIGVLLSSMTSRRSAGGRRGRRCGAAAQSAEPSGGCDRGVARHHGHHQAKPVLGIWLQSCRRAYRCWCASLLHSCVFVPLQSKFAAWTNRFGRVFARQRAVHKACWMQAH